MLFRLVIIMSIDFRWEIFYGLGEDGIGFVGWGGGFDVGGL